MPVVMAREKDFLDVWFLLNRCTAEMNRQSMFHWNPSYPDAETILSDIQEESLYLYHVDGVCQGIIVLNQEQAREYKTIPWKNISGKILVVHRLAVHPLFQQKGIGKLLMEFAIEYARENEFDSMRLDVYRDHPAAGKMYRNLGFRETGSFHFPHQESPFDCYELKL